MSVRVRWPGGYRKFDTGVVTIGRSDVCDIVIDDDRVSRDPHCTIDLHQDPVRLHDSSTRGTFLGGVRVQDQPIEEVLTVRLGSPDGPEIVVEPDGSRPRDLDERSEEGGAPHVVLASGETRTLAELDELAASGGRIVVFDNVVSVILRTYEFRGNLHAVAPGQKAPRGLLQTFTSIVFGWWGIPWGPVRTVLTVIRNLRGGRDVTEEVRQDLQRAQASGRSRPVIDRKRPYGALAAGAVVVAIAGAIAFTVATTTDTQDLGLGDCFAYTTGVDVRQVADQSCSDNHGMEVVGTYELSSHAGDGVVQAEAGSRCNLLAEQNIIYPQNLPPDAELFSIVPSSEAFDDGDRKVICVVGSRSGIPGPLT